MSSKAARRDKPPNRVSIIGIHRLGGLHNIRHINPLCVNWKLRSDALCKLEWKK